MRLFSVLPPAVLGILASSASLRAATLVVTAPTDGVTDASPAITATLKKAAPGDVVQLPAGTYALGSSIDVPTKVTLEGAGADKTTLKATGALDAMITMSHVDHVVVRALALDGNGTRASHGIVANDGSALEIDRIEAKNLLKKGIFGPFGVYWSANVRDSTIHRSFFHDIGPDTDWGVAIRVEGGARVTLQDNRSLHTGRGAYHIKLTTDAVIRNNTGHDFHPLSDALGIEAFSGCDRVVIEDNEIDSWLSLDSTPFAAVRRNKLIPSMTTRNGQIGLEIVASPDVLMSDNQVVGPLSAGIGVSIDSTPHLVLARNTIDGARGTLVEGQWNGGARPPTVGIYSYRNRYQNAPARAVHLHGASTSGFVFDHDVVKDWGSSGFFIQVSRVLLDSVTLENAKALSGFFTDGTEVYVRDCVGSACPSGAPALPSPSPLPSASFTAKVTGLAIEVDASASKDPKGGALHALFDFGEGPAMAGTTAKYAYSAAGKKSVALVVWSADGWGSRSEQSVDVGDGSDGGVGAVDAASDAITDASDVAGDDVATDAADDAATSDGAAVGDSPATSDGSCACRVRPSAANGEQPQVLAALAALAVRRRAARRRS